MIIILMMMSGSKELRGRQKTVLLRGGRRIEVVGGLDFSKATFDAKSGKKCVLRNVEVDSLSKRPILQCKHRYVIIDIIN